MDRICRLLVRVVLLSILVPIPLLSQQVANVESPAGFDQIALIEDDQNRDEVLREGLAAVESLPGRLALLDEAAEEANLAVAAARIRFELLLLSGQSAEAEALLDSSPILGSEFAELLHRLHITHGSMALSADGTDDGISRAIIDSRAAMSGITPESLAAKRGMLLSTGLLFASASSPENPPVPSPVPISTGSGAVSIQLGAFSRKTNAESHLQYLAQRGVSAEIITSVGQSGAPVYKTVVTGIPAEEGMRELVRLKEKGIEGFILR